MPRRATKRGAEHTPLERDCDVLICGASFSGLAVARELVTHTPHRTSRHRLRGLLPVLATLAWLPFALTACGGGKSNPPGMKRVTGGGAAVLVPSSFYVADAPQRPDVIEARASKEIRPDQPRLGVGGDTPGGSTFIQIIGEDLNANTEGLIDYHVTSKLRPVHVPGAMQAMQAEFEFTSGFKHGSKRWRTHGWIRYATPDAHPNALGDFHVYALSVLVPSVAKSKPDVPAILNSFELTG